MAGGVGTRLWPMSRRGRPKQLLPLVKGKSLLRLAYQRIADLLPAENIFIVTGKAYIAAASEALPELPQANFIGEPEGRDTANAVGLGAVAVSAVTPAGVIATLTADHIITPVEQFHTTLERAFAFAEANPQFLGTLGVTPLFPATGFGYIQCGKALDGEPGNLVIRVRRFTEKPDAATARQYLSEGAYYWNSGMFVWPAATILSQLETHLNESYQRLMKIAEAWTGPRREETLGREFVKLPKISIDYAVMEKAEDVFMVPLDCDWHDLGSWTSLTNVVPLDQSNNAVVGDSVVTIDSSNNVLVTEGDHLIATIGLDDVIVVHTADATLICAKDQAQQIKDLVSRLSKSYDKKYE